MECGGGFGGKIRALCEPITAILARATGRPVRYVMTRREELQAGMPAPAGHHPAEDGREARRHADGARGRGHPRVRRVLRRRAGGQRRLPGEPLPVAELRRQGLRGAHPQAEHRRLSRAGRAADDLRDRLAHGAARARRIGARPGRVPASPPAARRRQDGERPAVAQQRRRRGADPHRRASAVEEARRMEGEQPAGPPARDGAIARRLARRSSADRRHRAAQSGRHAPGADGSGRHRRDQHRAGADRRHGVWRRHRQGEDHDGRHRRGADDWAQRRQQDAPTPSAWP